MTTEKTAARKASYEVNTLAKHTGPLHQELIRLFNDYHEAVATGDEKAMHDLDDIVPQVLEEFERAEAGNAPNPQWLVWKMRAGWHVARGYYEKALACEQEGLKHAEAEPDDPQTREEKAKRRSISASNIADELRRLGRPAEALVWARLSVELWPANTINHLVLALAVYRAGFPEEAGQIIEKLLRLGEFRSGRDILANCMAYERDLHEMTDLASVQQLLRNVASVGGV